MKKTKTIAVMSIVFLLLSVLILQGCSNSSKGVKSAESYLRIHIRANSNTENDQNIKYKIKDRVVKYLTPVVASITSLSDLKQKLNSNLSEISSEVNQVLQDNGYGYKSKAKLNKEFFPTRYYGDNLLPADYYDALIIELGTAEGDNWWCVVYPPLCFIGGESAIGVEFKYKSKIKEIIDNFFGNN